LANEQLERQSRTDGLTGVFNRRYFDELLEYELSRAARTNENVSLLIIDIDHFKLFNDQYGHQIGDTCLQWVTRVIVEHASRPADVVARYGGEEFVIILPNTDLEGARMVAENIRRGVEASPVRIDGQMLGVTISIGFSCRCCEEDDTPERLLGRADEALYMAKAAGRNCVVSL
jgi:diguanylate cyclase